MSQENNINYNTDWGLRDQIIRRGLENNNSAEAIDKTLKQFNFQYGYNPITSGVTYSHTVKRVPENAKEFMRDATTFGGMVVEPFARTVDEVYKAPLERKVEQIKESVSKNLTKNPAVQKTLAGMVAGGAIGAKFHKLGAIPGAIIGGIIPHTGIPGFIDANLSPYNTSIKDITSGKFDWRNVAIGASNNPVYAGLDLSSLGLGKLGGKATHSLGNAISKDSPTFIRQLFPSTEQRNLNRILSDTVGSAKAKTGQNYKAYSILEGLPKLNREELVKHIVLGDSNLKGKERTLATGIRDSLRKNEELGKELGLLDTGNILSRDETIAQYVMQKVGGSSNLLHSDIRDIIKKNPLRVEAQKEISSKKLQPTIDSLIKVGSDLYDKNQIAYLSQKFAPQRDPLGNVIASQIHGNAKNYFDTHREIGRATVKQLGEVADETIKFQLDQISHSKEFSDILDVVLKETAIGEGLSPQKIKEVKKVALESIANDIRKGELPDLNKALQRSGLKKELDPVYFNTLNNVFKKPLNAGMRRVLSAFKKNVLATPHWVILNRVGNYTNNILEGVGIKDYADTIKYKKYIPEQLKNQTSFSSYLNEGLENLTDPGSAIRKGASSAITVPLNKLKRAGEKFGRSSKSLDDIGDYASSLYANTNDILANPIFRLESTLELTDRYANYIRQARRLAEKEGKSVVDVLKEGMKDDKIFNQLNTEVNKSLGDYVGRQYNLPAGFYNALSEVVPFYRFYAQTLRTTAHQMANRNLQFQSSMMLPNKLGKQKSEELMELTVPGTENKLFDSSMYRGGIPYAVNPDGSTRFIGFEPSPLANILGLGGEMMKGEDLTSILNPVVSSIAPALYFEKFGKEATYPGMTVNKFFGLQKGDEGYLEPTTQDKMKYLLNAMLSSTSAWYNMGTRWGKEFTHGLLDKPLGTTYDSAPFTEIPDSYKRTLPSELFGKQLGIRYNTIYQPYIKSGRMTKSEMKRRARRSNRFLNKIQLRKQGTQLRSK